MSGYGKNIVNWRSVTKNSRQKTKKTSDFCHMTTCSIILNKELQVNLFQNYLFLHQLTHNMTTDCSLNYKFNKWKFQAQTGVEHVVYRYCFWHSEQFLCTTCSHHVLEKEERLTKIYLYSYSKTFFFQCFSICLDVNIYTRIILI